METFCASCKKNIVSKYSSAKKTRPNKPKKTLID